MKADDESSIEYNQHPWGDLIYGAKAQLQSLGLAIGQAFPGEANGPKPKGTLCVRDPRGLLAEIAIASYHGEGCFSASIRFADRQNPRHVDAWRECANGLRFVANCGGDTYRGTAEALVHAGLVPTDGFPSMPGRRKVRVAIFPDGEFARADRPTGDDYRKRLPGAKTIQRVSKTEFSVCIEITKEEHERRWEAGRRAEAEWEREMASLPRPARLRPACSVVNFDAATAVARRDAAFQRFMKAARPNV